MKSTCHDPRMTQLDNSCPATLQMPHLQLKQKKAQMEEERFAKVRKGDPPLATRPTSPTRPGSLLPRACATSLRHAPTVEPLPSERQARRWHAHALTLLPAASSSR
jgi:hypothetical protein